MIQIKPDKNGILTQWDIDRYAIVSGVDSADDVEIHVSSESDRYGAYVVLPEMYDGVMKAVIPNVILTYAGMVNIYVYQGGITVFRQLLTVSSREKPDDYIYTPSEVDGYIRIKEEEAKRQAAEDERVSAEAIRQANETERNSAEAERMTAEDERVTTENVRQSNETSRVNAEYDRAASEASRISAEQTREKNEITRSSNEINRQSNENERQNSEEDRIEFETARAAAESLRLQNETARTASENERISAETQRVANEAGRVTAEAARVEAEANRQGTYQQYGNQIGDLNQLTTTSKANLVAAVNELHRDIDMVMTEQDEDIAAIQSDINEINQLIDYINDIDNEQSQAIVKIQSDTTSLKDKNQSQDEAISEIEQSITNINATDAAQSQAISSLSDSVDTAFAKVEDALDTKQPVGNYVTSVNGTAPDKSGNVSINVQTYTAGDGISIDEGAISVTNPMDDEQVSSGTTWSSAKIISSVSQSFQQSGSIITCQPVEGSPLHVVSEITAVQEGEGDPSPDNVRPISGWDSASLTRCGKNLLDLSVATLNACRLIDLQSATIQSAINNNYYSIVRLPKLTIGGVSITFSQAEAISDRMVSIIEYSSPISESTSDSNQVTKALGEYSKRNALFNIEIRTNRSKVLQTDLSTVIHNLQIELGSTATTYEPYRGQTYTADFGETVYGGTLDWATGVLTVDRKSITLDGSEDWGVYKTDLINGVLKPVTYSLTDSDIGYNTSICSRFKNVARAFASNELWIYSDHNNLVNKYFNVPIEQIADLDAWKTYLSTQKSAGTPVQLVYQLATPYTIQLTPAQVLAISGTNTVYCDTGDITVSGYEDPRHTVAKLTSRIAALESAATGI